MSEPPTEESPPSPGVPLPTAANSQLRGVVKSESQEPVPSPAHPPVVINAADDDEDEDDQFSEGEDMKSESSPRKLLKSGDALNFGVSTLEELRLRKAIKANMRKAGYPLHDPGTLTSGKENLESFSRPALCVTKEETGRLRGSIVERLGRKMPFTGGEGLLKRNLSERLGRVCNKEEPKRDPKPIRARLGMPADFVDPTDQADALTELKKNPEQIRIKTLEEIRQEKAAKSQSQTHADSPSFVGGASKAGKRAMTVKSDSIGHEILQTKKKRVEDQQEHIPCLNKTDHKSENILDKGQAEPNTAKAETKNSDEVRVKTLEEIRRERAARKALQATKAETTKPKDEESKITKPGLLHISKPSSPNSTKTEEVIKPTPKSVKGAASESGLSVTNSIKVKTFEEIMRDKRLRKQELEEQKKAPEVSHKQTVESAVKRKADSSVSTESSLPAPKRIQLKAKSAPTVNSPVSTLVDCSPQIQEHNVQTSKESTGVLDKAIRKPIVLSQARQASTAADKTQNLEKKKSPEHSKVRPKLNVRPSVVRPAAPVKPDQKRQKTERSMVAAVKPLNSSSAEVPELLQEPDVMDEQVSLSSSSEAQLSSADSQSPTPRLDSSSSKPKEIQSVPVFKRSQIKETKSILTAATPIEAPTLLQGHPQKTSTQSKAQRQSTNGSRHSSTSSAAFSNSAMDDFEQLMNEFTDDHLEEDVDPGIGEDDLLQELSEMIDS
ncbi:zinc finger CCCH domain-containing protein 11A isoform X3 [Cynoglossus semilaevis]|nr:zinc finger CCCH domain-containing protein 11A isoform X3 [Cynoglossus semilaevis]